MRLTFDPRGFKEPKLYLSHEQLARVLGKMYPGTRHGVDYLVGHMIDPQTGLQGGAAQLMAWNLPTQPPTIDNEIAAAWTKYSTEIADDIAAATARAVRSQKLVEADVLVNKAHDSMDRQALVKAMSYRQALRDISLQPGFPHEFTWPDKPV